MNRFKKAVLLKSLGKFIRSHSKARKLTPMTSIELNEEEVRYLFNIPQLNIVNRITFETGEFEGRPSIVICDNYLQKEDMILKTHFIPSHQANADGYAKLYVDYIVERLNNYETIQAIIHSQSNFNLNKL